MKRPFLLFTVVMLGASILIAEFSSKQTVEQSVMAAPGATGAQTVPAGLRVEIDPATREFIEPTTTVPATDAYPVELQDAVSTSSDGLQVVDAPVGSGKMVSLQGRFQNTYTASVDEGKLVAECDVSQTDTEEE